MGKLENNPIISQLHAMKQRMDVLYAKSFEESQESEPFEPTALYRPPVDIWDTGDEWLIIADLPGVQNSDLQVECAENRLLIHGRRRTAVSLDNGQATQRERPEGGFSRTFILPAKAQADTIRAELKHGVLTVVIGKMAEISESPHRVEVQGE